MSGIGSQLRETRESMGYTLDQAQESTKIHIEYLRALENDQFETLPSPFYVRAFLRTYAHSLGLDAQPLLDHYERAAVSSRTPRRGAGAQAGRNGRPAAGGQARGIQSQPRLGRNYSPRSQGMTPSSRTRQGHPYGKPSQQQTFAGGNTQPYHPSQLPPQPMPQPPQQQRTGRFNTLPSGGGPGTAPQQPTLSQRQQTGAQPAVSQNTMVPRRVQQQVNRGLVQGDGKVKKKGASTWVVRVAVIGALLLVPVGGWAVMGGGGFSFNDSPAAFNDTGDDKGTGGQQDEGDTVNAETPATVSVAKVETGDDIEGDLYSLKGAKKVEIEVKANKGDSGLTYGYETNNQKENFTLKVGEKRVLEDKDFIWFRLFKPSNTQIKINGEDLDTMAQDVPKSYRIQLQK